MRDAFVREISEIAAADPHTLLMTGDLGFGVLTGFSQRFPAQYINAGVAEQNMTGMAVGLALEGKTVFTYSIANFNTLRCLEQIRNDAAYHRANVKIVSVGGGFSYGPLGISHHATEDLAILRAIPDVVVLAPGDPVETRLATRLAHDTPGTIYLRLGRGGEPVVHVTPPRFEIGRAICVREGRDVAIISTGALIRNALDAAAFLEARGWSPAVYSVPFVKPLDDDLVRKLAVDMRVVATVEEHTTLGGFGSAVAEVWSGVRDRTGVHVRIGLDSRFSSMVGSQDFLRAAYGLSADAIARAVLEALDRR